MDNYGRIVILLGFIGIVIFIFLLGFQVVIPVDTSNSSLVDDAIDDVLKTTGWSDPTPVDGERGLCNLYQTASIETAVVDSLEPIGLLSSLPESLRCDDGFVKALARNTRVCELEQCIGSDGVLYNEGQTEELYLGCADLPLCENGRSGLIFNFQTDGTGKLDENSICLRSDSDNPAVPFTTGECFPPDVFNAGVFFNIDQLPTSGGSYVRIRAPATNLCLAPLHGQLVSDVCTNFANEGFEWFFNFPYMYFNFTQVDDVCTIVPGGTRTFPAQLFQRPTQIIPPVPDVDINTCEGLTALRTYFFEVEEILDSYAILRTDSDGNLFLDFGTQICLGDDYPEEECSEKTAIISAFSWSSIQP